MADVQMTSRLDEVLEACDDALERALVAIGMTAEDYAKRGCPVDTGRLRNSITYAMSKHYGTYSYKDSEGKEYTDTAGQTEKNAVYIGTNVEYAPFQELGTVNGVPAHHFLKNAAANHTQKYKKLIEESMKNA